MPRQAEEEGKATTITAVAASAPTGLPNDDKFARLRARFAAAEPANDNGAPLASTAALERHEETTDTAKIAVDKASMGKLVDVIGPIAPQLVVGLLATVCRWSGRIPQEPDPEWVAKLRECTDTLIRQKLPQIEVGPVAGMGIYGGMAFLSMYMGAEKIQKPAALPPSSSASSSPPTTTGPTAQPAPDHARTPATAEGSSLPPISPSPTSDDTTATVAPGNVTSAPDGPSAHVDGTTSAGSAI